MAQYASYSGFISGAAGGGAGVTTVSASAPIASSGGATPNISLTGTVAIAHGGTGQITAPLAINALLPSQGGNSGKFLTTNGTVAAWGTAGGGGGANTALSNLASVQVNTDLIPDTNVTYDLGSITKRWDQIYAGSIYDGSNFSVLNVDSRTLKDSTGANVVDFSGDLISYKDIKPQADLGVNVGSGSRRFAQVFAAQYHCAARVDAGAAITVDPTYDFFIVSTNGAGATINLPVGVDGMDFKFYVATAAGAATLAPNGADTIDATTTIAAAGSRELIFVGGVWYNA